MSLLNLVYLDQDLKLWPEGAKDQRSKVQRIIGQKVQRPNGTKVQRHLWESVCDEPNAQFNFNDSLAGRVLYVESLTQTFLKKICYDLPSASSSLAWRF